MIHFIEDLSKCCSICNHVWLVVVISEVQQPFYCSGSHGRVYILQWIFLLIIFPKMLGVPRMKQRAFILYLSVHRLPWVGFLVTL